VGPVDLPAFHPDHISQEDLINRMNEALALPAWPLLDHAIRGRIEMLSTGLRTPSGSRSPGRTGHDRGDRRPDRAALNTVEGTRSVFAEKPAAAISGYRVQPGGPVRYGLSIAAVQEVIQRAIGGENITTTIEGRERYPVNIRTCGLPDRPRRLGRVLVAAGGDRQIPLSQLATIKLARDRR